MYSPTYDDSWSVYDARGETTAALSMGWKGPCLLCGEHLEWYYRSIDHHDAKCLAHLVAEGDEHGRSRYHHFPSIARDQRLEDRGFPKLRFWGLVEMLPEPMIDKMRGELAASLREARIRSHLLVDDVSLALALKYDDPKISFKDNRAKWNKKIKDIEGRKKIPSAKEIAEILSIFSTTEVSGLQSYLFEVGDPYLVITADNAASDLCRLLSRGGKYPGLWRATDVGCEFVKNPASTVKPILVEGAMRSEEVTDVTKGGGVSDHVSFSDVLGVKFEYDQLRT